MSLYCDYLNIGSFELDQSETKEVMAAMQTFTNYYPDSEYTQKINDHLDELRGKLQNKEYAHVIQYFKMGEFKAAVTSAKNTVKLFPDIKEREDLEFITVKSQYIYAMNSIEKKRKERLEEVLTNFEDYKYNNDKNSAHYNEALDYKIKAEKEIKVLKELL
jgi:outer membrane protein assembly factor BamD